MPKGDRKLKKEACATCGTNEGIKAANPKQDLVRVGSGASGFNARIDYSDDVPAEPAEPALVA